ncbi:hypothetical protein [Tepidibacillus fermentans]|uniref:Uncharacterized protein n=1 Tax=Tepidibacillus fermentans TaxID=1281767 RepID=A0A4R3KD40_9BACI|nr:hypothetical protein [Tepidibacillus fermentans]TCS81048.1 hypothetical protein EDD72_11425 [Tepidibacillus fermentans]
MRKICMTFQENTDIKVGDKIIVKLPHETIEREFTVIKLDHSLKNLPVIEYQGKELLIDRSMILISYSPSNNVDQ